MCLSCAVDAIFNVKYWRDLKSGLGNVQGHGKRCWSIDHIRLYIGLSL